MQKIKVCHFYAGNRFGGLENILINLQKFSNPESPVSHSFQLCFQGELLSQLRKHKAEVEWLPVSSLVNVFQILKMWLHLFTKFNNQSINFLVSHEIWNYLLGYFPAKLAGIKTILWCHSAFFDTKFYGILRWMAPDYVISTSQNVSELFSKRWPQLPIQTLYCPHSLADGVRQVKGTPHSQAPAVLLYVGRLAHYKGLHILVRALSLIKDSYFKLVIVGGPQSPAEQKYLDVIKGTIKTHDLQDKVEFAGQRNDVESFYYQSDLFCHPNVAPEAFGLVFIEALYAGLPIIATQIGGAVEIFSRAKRNIGRLVRPNDEFELASTLREYLSKPLTMSAEDQAHARDIALSFCEPKKAMTKIDQFFISMSPTDS